MVQTYIMSGMKSDFTTKYSPPISLDESKQYEAALLSIDLFNSIPNITNLNNVLRYSTAAMLALSGVWMRLRQVENPAGSGVVGLLS